MRSVAVDVVVIVKVTGGTSRLSVLLTYLREKRTWQ